MSKRAQYYDRCRDLYVKEGYTVRAIAKMVNKKHPDAPTRRTIQNWKDDGNWEAKREKFIEQTEDLFDITREVAKMAGKNAKENPTNENINSFVRILTALKYKDQIRSINDVPEGEDDGRSKKEKIEELKNEIEDIMGA